jgi:hypothetical protein
MAFTRHVCYDLETFKDYFVCCIKGALYRIEDAFRLRNAMSRDDTLYVSFNGVGYDNIILGFVFWADTNRCLTTQRIKELSDCMIEKKNPDDSFVQEFMELYVDSFSVWRKGEQFHSYRLKSNGLWYPKAQFCDLYLVGNKKGGLKKAAVVMDFEDLSECPIAFNQETTTKEERKTIDKYCIHDVDVTEGAFKWHEKEDNIGVRTLFAMENDIQDAYILGAAALSEKYFRYKMLAENPKWQNELDDHKNWRQKPPGTMPTSELIRCGRLNFRDPNFVKFQDFIRMTEFDFEGGLSASSSDEFDDEGDTSNTAFLLNNKSIPKNALIITDRKGHQYQFGVGGLHDLSMEGIWCETDTHILRNVDVKSYYPSMIVSWKIHPRHFPRYADYISECLATRLEAKKNPALKGKANALKLAMNSSFGKMKDKFCSLYDPYAHFSVTMTGQMGLLYLIDQIYVACPSVEVVNANTDGVCVRMKKGEEPMFQAVCTEWEKVMRVSLEFENYTKWAQRSCNLYCALKDNGEVKTKGVQFKAKATDLGEGYKSPRAVKTMVVRHLLFGEKLADVARSLEPKMFLISNSCGAKTRMVYNDEVLEHRTSIRYVFAKKGFKLQQRNTTTGKLSEVKDGSDVLLVEKLGELTMDSILIERYVAMAKDIVNQVLRANEKKKVQNEGFFSLFD